MATTINTPISGDGYLNASEITQPLTISGTTTLGNKTVVTVTIAPGVTQSYTFTSGGTTAWSVTFTPAQLTGLADGTYTVEVRAEPGTGQKQAETVSANLMVLTQPDPVTGVYITGFDATTGEATFEVRGLHAGSTTTVTFKQTGKSDVTLSNLGPAGADGKILGKVMLSGWSNDGITAHLAVKDVAQNNWSYDFSPTMENDVVICFYPGTLIRTPDSEVAVETLKIGDLVLTAEGKVMPIRWIGRQTVSTIFADPLRVLPIRITAGALGENLPVRDLLVSPDHALLVDSVLVQAGALVNGTTIRRESDVPTTFTYYHVELADHSLILAEGVPAETFVDNVERLAFDNWEEHEALYGDLPPIMEMELPRAKAQRQVPMATRQRLAARAAMLLGEVAAAA